MDLAKGVRQSGCFGHVFGPAAKKRFGVACSNEFARFALANYTS
ncbi:hypothetical protein BQ8482_110967 [Mesorhizobium delmotii]|uniref:Uncharacterized protein n=1 Tax=Mesorhizobium delmotii TaxID=1631247 RepID=A0A2P9AD21_9HYPH|nr:hypothetical protein BQ8482_110967 [Mesorhizobium delmotii]